MVSRGFKALNIIGNFLNNLNIMVDCGGGSPPQPPLISKGFKGLNIIRNFPNYLDNIVVRGGGSPPPTPPHR